MSKKVVSRCRVWVNGTEVIYFKGFTEDEREIRQMTKLMAGFALKDVESAHTFKIDYVKPKGTPIDWDAFEDGTIEVQLVGAEKVQFAFASTLKVGAWDADNEKEIVQPIFFGAVSRKTL